MYVTPNQRRGANRRRSNQIAWIEALEPRVMLSVSTIYSANMDTDPGWTLQGLWQYGTPTSNPSSAKTGSNCIGVNLAGNYMDNMSAEYATTPAIDCSNYRNVHLNFYRFLGIESSNYDHVSIQASNNGSNWSTVWDHSGMTLSDADWTPINIDLSSVANHQPTVFVRWGMGPTDHVVNYTGWTVDDVTVTGDPGPTAEGVLTNLRAVGETAHEIAINYTSLNDGLDTDTLGNNDLQIVGPGDVTLSATYVSQQKINDTTWQATYSVVGPGGTWDAADAGIYNVHVVASSVLDDDGDGVQATQAGSFKVWQILPLSNSSSASFEDKDGDTVTITLKGPGTGEVRTFGNGSDFDSLLLEQTTTASTLTIKAKGPQNRTDINPVTITGDLKSLIATTGDVADDIVITGGIKTLTLGDAQAGAVISIGQDPTIASTAITLGRIESLNLTSQTPIKWIKAVEWREVDGTSNITAPTIKSVQITGSTKLSSAGDFHADIHADSLGSVKIHGQIHGGQWAITGDADAIVAGSMFDASISTSGSLKSLTAGRVQDSTVVVGGSVGLVKIYEWNVGKLRAASLKTLSITGNKKLALAGDADFEMELGQAIVMDTEAPILTAALSNATIAGNLTNEWTIGGSVGSVTVRGNMSQWLGHVVGNIRLVTVGQVNSSQWQIAGRVGTLKAKSTDESSLVAGSFGNVSASGDWSAYLTANDVNAATSINKLTVGGWLSNSLISAQSNINSVSVGGIFYSGVVASAASDHLPVSLDDFTAQKSLGSFTVRGNVKLSGHSMFGCIIAAYNVGKVSLRNVDFDNDGTAFGIGCATLKSFRLDGKAYDADHPVPDPGDFNVSVLG